MQVEYADQVFIATKNIKWHQKTTSCYVELKKVESSWRQDVQMDDSLLSKPQIA